MVEILKAKIKDFHKRHNLILILSLGIFCLVMCFISEAYANENADKGDWEKLGAVKITQVLSARTLAYSSTISQKFNASGRTLYDTGTPSWGYWRVQGDQYCSQWPPQNNWTCYDLYISKDGVSIKFAGSGNNVSVGKYID